MEATTSQSAAILQSPHPSRLLWTFPACQVGWVTHCTRNYCHLPRYCQEQRTHHHSLAFVWFLHRNVLWRHFTDQKRTAIIHPQTSWNDLWTPAERKGREGAGGVWGDHDFQTGRLVRTGQAKVLTQKDTNQAAVWKTLSCPRPLKLKQEIKNSCFVLLNHKDILRATVELILVIDYQRCVELCCQ